MTPLDVEKLREDVRELALEHTADRELGAVLRDVDAQLARVAGDPRPDRVRRGLREALAALLDEHAFDVRVRSLVGALREGLAALAVEAGPSDCSGVALERRYGRVGPKTTLHAAEGMLSLAK